MTPAEPTGEEVRGLLDLVAERRGIDFRDYREQALQRGVLDRMARLSCRGPAEYRARLARDPEEVDRLVAALVVPVTGFFRDPPLFEALAGTVLPGLAAARPQRLLRAWVAGAATGEEAWSLAMLLEAACQGGPEFEIVASDVDAGSVAVARNGRYPIAAAEAVPPPLRERFLRTEGQEVSVADALRKRVVFARHDLMGRSVAPAEAIVASFHLISCRNVLIYFDRRLQQKALERLQVAIEPGGALVLGSVETLPPPVAANFGPWPGTDPSLRIFRRRGAR